MVRQFVVLLAVAVACAQAAATIKGEQFDTCMWGGFELKQAETVISANALGMCQRCHCEAASAAGAAQMVCDDEEQPCDPIDLAAAVEPLPAVAADIPAIKGRLRKARSPAKLSCADKKCVTACVMENGAPKCV